MLVSTVDQMDDALALPFNTTGSFNTALELAASLGNFTGSQNTVVGWDASLERLILPHATRKRLSPWLSQAKRF